MASRCLACISLLGCRFIWYGKLANLADETQNCNLAAGINVEHLPYVSVMEATAVKVHPVGQESSWNVDGELMPHNQLSAKVCQAAAQAFSRGIESADTDIKRQ